MRKRNLKLERILLTGAVFIAALTALATSMGNARYPDLSAVSTSALQR